MDLLLCDLLHAQISDGLIHCIAWVYIQEEGDQSVQPLVHKPEELDYKKVGPQFHREAEKVALCTVEGVHSWVRLEDHICLVCHGRGAGLVVQHAEATNTD